MAPKGSCKWMAKTTTRARILTSVLNRYLALDHHSTNGMISEHIRGLIRIYIIRSLKDVRAWDLFCDLIILDPVMTCRFSQFQLIWPDDMSTSLAVWEWWVDFRSYMTQMFDKMNHQMNNLRWHNPHAFRERLDCSTPKTPSWGMVERAGKRFSW